MLSAAEQQLEAAQGIEDTPFVTVKATINEKGEAIVEAFQVRHPYPYLALLCSAVFLSILSCSHQSPRPSPLNDHHAATMSGPFPQVSKQCMEMVAEGVLEPSVHLGTCTVNNTFTAIVEGKEAKEVRQTHH